MSHRLEFFFDCSSPWTYLAFETALKRLSDVDVEIIWRPFLVGGVFNTINHSVYESRERPVEAKARYMKKDLGDWAHYCGLKIGWPDVFPVNSVKAMRGAYFAIEQDCLVPYARAVFERYWSELDDISDDAVMREIVNTVGLDEHAFFAAIKHQDYKDKLREATDEVMARGGFGTPTMFLDGDDMYFGNDRIELIRARIVA